MMKYLQWIFINMILPLAPLVVRLFIIFISSESISNSLNIYNLPELVFYSFYLCAVVLNINIDGTKNIFESLLRFFMFLLVVFNSLTLGIIYSNNAGDNIRKYIFIAVVIPILITPIYKYKYRKIGANY